MILPKFSSDRRMHPERAPGLTRAGRHIGGFRPVQLSTGAAAFLRAELDRQVEIRPDVVDRARALAADPNYPSLDVLRKVAEQILTSPDLSEAGS